MISTELATGRFSLKGCPHFLSGYVFARDLASPERASEKKSDLTRILVSLFQRVQSVRKKVTSRLLIRDAEMTIKIISERSSQKGGRQGVRKEGQQGTRLYC